MTYEEAKYNIEAILEEATREENSVCYVTSDDEKSLKLAIEALENQIQYELYNDQLTDDMTYKEMMIKIAQCHLEDWSDEE